MESPDDTAAAAGVEERMGSKGVDRNDISFPRAGVKKVDSDNLWGEEEKMNNILIIILKLKFTVLQLFKAAAAATDHRCQFKT